MMKLIYGDCRKVLSEVESKSVDLLITDPPYGEQFNWVWKFLATEGNRILKTNGHLVSLLGHSQLPIAVCELSKTLRYWWICGLENRRSNKLFGKNLIIKFKPALWFLKGKRIRENGGYFPFDFVSCDSKSFREAKTFHKFGQPVEFFLNFIKYLTREEATVVDPFCGAGTTGVVCAKLDRNFIGIDIDKSSIDSARERIEDLHEGEVWK